MWLPLSILCRVDEAWTLRLCTCLSLVLGAPLGNGWVLGRNGSNDFFFFFLIHQPEIGGSSWKWLFPVKVAGNTGLPVAGARATGGNNVIVHSVCLCYRWNGPWGGPAGWQEQHRILWVRGEWRQQRGVAEDPTAHAFRHDLWLCLPQRYSELPEGSPMLRSRRCALFPPGLSDRGGYRCRGSRVWDTPHVSCAMTFTLWVTPSLLQGLPPCGTPNGVPGTLRPSPRCSPRGRVTCTWPTCSWRSVTSVRLGLLGFRPPLPSPRLSSSLACLSCPDAHGDHGFLPLQVNALIKEREGYAPGTEFHRCKEMSEYCSTLCRHLYLFPGHPPTWRRPHGPAAHRPDEACPLPIHGFCSPSGIGNLPGLWSTPVLSAWACGTTGQPLLWQLPPCRAGSVPTSCQECSTAVEEPSRWCYEHGVLTGRGCVGFPAAYVHFLPLGLW